MSRHTPNQVFVGNIPYDANEEQLKEIFSEVGDVVSFRLIVDKETGKPKGFGFCEYRDPDHAQCAMRNLQGREINGRNLRVDLSDKDNRGTEVRSSGNPAASGAYTSPYNGPGMGTPELQNDQISEELSLHKVIWSMKNLIANHPAQARQMLRNNPKLAVKLVEALQQTGKIDAARATQLIPRNATTGSMTPVATIPIHSQDINTPVGNFAPAVPNEPEPRSNQSGFGYPAPNQPQQPQQNIAIDDIRRQLDSLPTDTLKDLYAQTGNTLITEVLARRGAYPR